MNNKYTFIHPTKSGGTSVADYFEKNYKDYIKGNNHANKCNNNNNPIIIVRDVKSRFLSMYKYWKNGSELYRDNKKNNNNISILQFIELLKSNKKQLFNSYMWDVHYDNTENWINNTDYKNIIIIKYDKDLNQKIQRLINILRIPNKNIPLIKKNISKPINNESELNNPIVIKFIEEYFQKDIELINKIENNPELFKLVI
jgi:hypothetical protein